MLKTRIRRVVPSLGLAGVLLAMVLSGAAGAASPPVGDWKMDEGSGRGSRRLLDVREQRDDCG